MGWRRKVKGIETMAAVIVAVVVALLGIALAYAFYMRASGSISGMGTAAVSAQQLADGSVLISVTASGGQVTVNQIAVYGYSGGASAAKLSCSISPNPPQNIPTGQTLTFTASNCGGSPIQVVVYYNGGKAAVASIG